MNFRIASRQSQHWNRAGIDGNNRQIDQTTRTTRPPCQQARHIVVAQASRRMFMGIRPDTVMMLHGWWQGCNELGKPYYPLLRGGANANLMYSTDPKKAYDPVVTAMTSQTLVQVRKA